MTSRAPARGEAAMAVVIALITIGVYARALTAGFTADDFFILARVKAFGGLAHPLGYFGFGFFDYYRPLGFLSHAVDFSIWQLNPAGFHATNLLIHVVNGALVWTIARRLLGGGAGLAMLFFTVHPASHEAVYWAAARFDLLATAFCLIALLCAWSDRRWALPAAVLSYAAALLCKESALSLPVIVVALDVLIRQRDWRQAARRLAPFIVVTLIYVALRGAATDVLIAGGERRLPKMFLLGAALGGLLILARTGGVARLLAGPRRRPAAAIAAGVAIVATLFVIALALPATAHWAREKLGFVAYAVYSLFSPIVTIGPPQPWFEPAVMRDAIPGLVALVIVVAAVIAAATRVRDEARLGFLTMFVAAAVLPVLSMTGGMRYFYFASAGVALIGAWASRTALASRWATAALIAIPLVTVISITQIQAKGRDWQWAGSMTREGVALMAAHLEPCGTKDVVLLTAPVGIRGVYDNFYWEAFEVAHQCAPATFRTLLRVLREDAEVSVTQPSDGVVILRVPRYRGQMVGSADLSNFDRPIGRGETGTIATAIGVLRYAPDGDAEVFTLSLHEPVRGAGLYFYSLGQIHSAAPGR